MNEILEGLAEKMLAETIENIRRLGFAIVIKDGYDKTIVKPSNVKVISEERAKRGDY